jgi:hypothetical protein
MNRMKDSRAPYIAGRCPSRHRPGDATRGHIRIQFLSEAIMLSLVGGTVGIILGAISTGVYAHTRGWQIVIPTEAWGPVPVRSRTGARRMSTPAPPVTAAFILASYRPDEPAGMERAVAALASGLCQSRSGQPDVHQLGNPDRQIRSGARAALMCV